MRYAACHAKLPIENNFSKREESASIYLHITLLSDRELYARCNHWLPYLFP